MNLLCDPWIPVRADGGMREFRQITYEELLCQENSWQISLPRDDLELASLQLLICLTQVIFMPYDDPTLRQRIRMPLTKEEFLTHTTPLKEWFDLNHPKWPFMQIRGVSADEVTPIQKLLVGMPEGNNHAFFNEVNEVRRMSAACTAIALFNQASDSPSFGGRFKAGLRGGSPATTLVLGDNLRRTVWKNVITLSRIQERLPEYTPDVTSDTPTWVDPIKKGETIHANSVGLLRGLFWQPAHIELLPPENGSVCELLGMSCDSVYTGFLKERFGYTVVGLWPHPHGAMMSSERRDKVARTKKLSHQFISFTSTAPAWTKLSEFVVPHSINEETEEGTTPAAPVTQAAILFPNEPLHLLVGGYRVKKALVLERRHELMSLAQSWADDRGRLRKLVHLALDAKKVLRGKLYLTVKGNKKRELKGIGTDIHETGERMFFDRTEGLLHQMLRSDFTFREFMIARERFGQSVAEICRRIFADLTDPYAMKPEFIPIIAMARRSLGHDLEILAKGGEQIDSPEK